MKAFNGSKQLKTAMISMLDWHADQDRIIKGSYGNQCQNGDFRGCAIGCSIHSLALIQKRKLNSADHNLMETELGIPVDLAWLIDGLFEALPDKESTALPRRVINAITPGADLSMVIPQFLLWMLSDPKIGSITDAKYQETKTFVNAVIAIFDEWVKTGEKPLEDSALGKAARAARAAWDARDARAARVAWDARAARAARDARAVWDARDARAARVAWDARAARAARDARAVWDARDARDARNKAAADKLIELLEEAL